MYSEESLRSFRKALKNAQSVLDDNTATESEVDLAIEDLREAIHQLVPLNSGQAPEAVSKIMITLLSYKSVSVVWNAVEGATEYDVYVKSYKKGASYQKLDTVYGISADISGLMVGKEYSYCIVAKNEYGEAKPSKAKKFTIVLGSEDEFELYSSLVSSNKIQLEWTKVNGATRYIIYRKRGKDSYQKVVTLAGD